MDRFAFLPLSLLITASLPTTALADHVELPTMSVAGTAGEMTPYALPETAVSSPDSGEMVKKLPGANINQNGPLTSIVQYRGLFGDRVNVLIDGVRISQAGPNRMDSPLSYLPASRVGNITLYRGIAPVSSGIETIGGTIMAESKKAAFASGDEAEIHGNLSSGYASNGDTRFGSVTGSIADQHHRLQLSASLDRGNDLEFDGGKILPSEHERDTVGLAYGFKQKGTELELELDHHDTGRTGTPALPMDIIWARGENLKAQLSQSLENGGKLRAKVHYQDADHRMDNYSLRPAGMLQRHTDSDVIAQGYRIDYSQSGWQVGIEGDTTEHNADIFDPTNTMFRTQNFNNVERDRFSAFAEWNGALNDDWQLESGLRLSRIETDAGQVDSSMAMMMAPIASLRDRFNSADRSQQDNLADIVVKFTRTLTSALDLEIGLARKQRAPSYQERYLWLPLQSTSGLADGKNYVGNIELDPETAYQLELGLDWHTSKAAFSPRVFYHHINDYIQGVSSADTTVNMVSNNMNPTAGTPLQFSNVDARLYGIDTNWLLALTDNWQLDGTISYVRGKRRDTSDNLYRIAPLTARTMLSYIRPDWRAGVEAVTVAAQNQVSAENDEQQTGAYALFNLAAQYAVSDRLTVNAGINNLFDRFYQDHLAGYNRVSGNADIAVGDRLPGLGRSVYISLNLDW
ncbi:TonB-dependent receptor [Methylophaga sp. OBS4]|uniref:TonB-dependent receptor n=1 Tax=Methylophaga sp. OBS4 TaxID=2991935 RepID=UPI002257907D|nr:TonB-dependent receptor [Methylophaga sp. OBS4]MCX4186413.1 TonB-dependent receptor [Methylophaga sp. OBS4]